jgi:hypothetical protein
MNRAGYPVPSTKVYLKTYGVSHNQKNEESIIGPGELSRVALDDYYEDSLVGFPKKKEIRS